MAETLRDFPLLDNNGPPSSLVPPGPPRTTQTNVEPPENTHRSYDRKKDNRKAKSGASDYEEHTRESFEGNTVKGTDRRVRKDRRKKATDFVRWRNITMKRWMFWTLIVALVASFVLMLIFLFLWRGQCNRKSSKPPQVNTPAAPTAPSSRLWPTGNPFLGQPAVPSVIQAPKAALSTTTETTTTLPTMAPSTAATVSAP